MKNNNKTKILFISPIRKGGPYNVLKNLSKEFDKNSKYQTKFYASLKGYLFGIFSNRYDIIHTVLPIPFNIFRKKIILHIHGDYRIEKSLNNPLGYIYPLAIKNADKIIVPSNFLKKKLDIKNAIVINNPIEDKKIEKIKYSLIKKDTIKLFIVTKFHFYDKAKGVIDLLTILNKIETNKTIELDIYGEGKYKNKIQEICQTNKKKFKVCFKGFSNNLDKESTNYDIFTYYSHLDTFGVIIAEMQRNGLPIITNEFGAAKELIKNNENGFISNNEIDYKNKLEKLINNEKLRKNMGINAKKTSQKLFLNNIN
jgi:glycosyltransferase involved in cell wall biosynthesis